MNEHAIRCVESVITSIRQAKISPSRGERRTEIIALIQAYVRTLTGDVTIPVDHIMQLANLLYTVYSVGKLDGWSEAIAEEGK